MDAFLTTEPAPIFITVILPDGSLKEFSCDTDWTVGEIEVKIHTTYKLTGGRLTRNSITVKDSLKLEPSMNGQLKFVDAIQERPHIGLASDRQQGGLSLIEIPSQRPWRPINECCPFLGGGKCPREKLVDVERAVNAAIKNVQLFKDEVERVPPVVISRVYRGGKTTLIDLISKKLSESSDNYVITISLNGGFHPREGESLLQGLVRLIAYQMVEHHATDRDDLFVCNEVALLQRLLEINNQNKTVILLVDELNKMGVPLGLDTSAFLTTNFLDKKGRYLIFSSHVQFPIDSFQASPAMTSSSGREMRVLPLPFCTERQVLQSMIDGSVTDLQITLTVGIPSLLYVMCKLDRTEMSFEQRFEQIMSYRLNAPRRSIIQNDFIAKNKEIMLADFLQTVVYGGQVASQWLQCFTTSYEGSMMFPLPYIPVILRFFGESDAFRLYESLKVSAETVENGRDWELVVVLSLYLRSLAAKYCKVSKGKAHAGAFKIATHEVNDVKVVTIPPEVVDVAAAVQHITEETRKAKTIYIFQLAYSKFPDFDGFVSYRSSKKHGRDQEQQAPIIHGFQCKLSRGYYRNPVDTKLIAKGWFIRGGTTVATPDKEDGWTYPTEEYIRNTILGFGLRPLHPVD